MSFPRYPEGGYGENFNGGFLVCPDVQALSSAVSGRIAYNARRTALELWRNHEKYDFLQRVVDEDEVNSGLVRVRLYDADDDSGKKGLLTSLGRRSRAGSFITCIETLKSFVDIGADSEPRIYIAVNEVVDYVTPHSDNKRAAKTAFLQLGGMKILDFAHSRLDATASLHSTPGDIYGMLLRSGEDSLDHAIDYYALVPGEFETTESPSPENPCIALRAHTWLE